MVETSAVAESTQPGRDASLPEGTPELIGRYRVKKLIGQGGMGRVFLATDTVLERDVAIKVLRDDLRLSREIREQLFRRMKHEAKAAGAISHPNLVTLHDMGEDDAVGVFLVFEYVEGPTLRAQTEDEPLDARKIAALARGIGAVLDLAHARGVIHRDVKPENILLSPTGPKLSDFGIARLPDSTLTTAGSILGTPAYCAPEALALGTFSAASDQFSFAATLFEAIAGSRAFPGEDALAVASTITSGEPAPLANPTGSSSLRKAELALRRGLSKEAKERFSSCSALAEAVSVPLLEHAERSPGASTSARPPAQSQVDPADAASRRTLHIGIGALMVLAFGGFVLWSESRHGSDAALAPAPSAPSTPAAQAPPTASPKRSRSARRAPPSEGAHTLPAPSAEPEEPPAASAPWAAPSPWANEALGDR